MFQCINQFSFLFLTHTLKAGPDYLVQLGWLSNKQMRHDMEKHIPFYIARNSLNCELGLPIRLDGFLGKLIQLFYSFLKAIWASFSLYAIVMYFLARTELNSKCLVDIVTRQIKAHQQNNEMLSAYGYELQRPVSLTHLEEFETAQMHVSKTYGMRGFNLQYILIFEIQGNSVRCIRGWKTHSPRCSASSHLLIQTTVRCFLKSVCTDYATADGTRWLERGPTSSTLYGRAFVWVHHRGWGNKGHKPWIEDANLSHFGAF